MNSPHWFLTCQSLCQAACVGLRRLLPLLLLLSFAAHADPKVLRVGVALGDPFVIAHDNTFSGVAIDIWKKLADDQHLAFQLIPMGEHIDDAVNQLAKGQIDVLIGPIVPTYDRMKLVDFMQPYYLNQIGLVVPMKRISFLEAFGSIFNMTTLIILFVLLLFFLFYLHIYWYYELKPHQKALRSYGRGIMEAFWLHTLDIDLGAIPTHPRTRQIRFTWLVLLTLLFSSLTASITSALTVALSDQYASYTSVDDFKTKAVAAVHQTAPFDIAREAGFNNLVIVNNREEAIQLLLAGKVAAYVDYYPIADYYLAEHQLTHQLMLASVVIQRNTFAFALPINSPLRHMLDVRLRSLQEDGVTQLICEKYFKKNDNATVNCEI